MVLKKFKLLLKFVSLLFVVWPVSGCAWLDTQQRAAIYRPSFAKADSFKSMEPTDEVVFLALASTVRSAISGGDYAPKSNGLPPDVSTYTSAWWLPSAKSDAPTIIYFHGVFRNLTYNYEKFNTLRQAGFNVLAVTYRGWPATSMALPSEQSIFEDAARGFEELRLRQPDPKKRLIYGHSMGGAVAVELASRLKREQDYGALMLESTFTSLTEVAAELRWYGGLLRPFATQTFDSLSKIKKVDAPIFMRHGDADNTVPFVVGQRLFAEAPEPKQFLKFEGGSHSGLHSEQPELYKDSAWKFWQEVNSKQN
jgi:uncharacterized protein